MTKGGPIPILELVNVLMLGGAEGQFLERLRTLDRRRYRPLVGALKPAGPHLEELRRLGIEPARVTLADSLAHPATAWAVARLAAWIRREGVRLVHAQDFYTNLLAVPAARLAGARVIVSRLDLAHWHGPSRRRALAWACRLADRVQVNALAIQRQLVTEERLPAERIALVPNGIDLAGFDARAREPLAAPLLVPEGARVVTIVANLNPVKGQEAAIDAVALLAARFPDLHLVLVGEGERRPLLAARAAARDVGDRVHLLGHRTDVAAVLRASDALVSTSHAEGLSNSIIEGMAARLPVVSTAVGGSPELVVDGKTGLLVPPRAPEALARALAQVLADADLARRLGNAARRFVAQELSVERMARGFAALYDAVLGESTADRVAA
jgi:glycosyltransferase involved in cell wall biosynthesis